MEPLYQRPREIDSGLVRDFEFDRLIADLKDCSQPVLIGAYFP